MSDPVVAGSVTLPVAVFVLTVWLLHAPFSAGQRTTAVEVVAAVVVTLAIPVLVLLGLPLPLVPWLATVPVGLLIATHVDRPALAAQPAP